MVATHEGAATVPAARLSRLRRDVQSNRLAHRQGRANAQAGESVRTAQQKFVAALRPYTDALESLGLPIPYTLRDELRIYGAATNPRARHTE